MVIPMFITSPLFRQRTNESILKDIDQTTAPHLHQQKEAEIRRTRYKDQKDGSDEDNTTVESLVKRQTTYVLQWKHQNKSQAYHCMTSVREVKTAADGILRRRRCLQVTIYIFNRQVTN